MPTAKTAKLNIGDKFTISTKKTKTYRDQVFTVIGTRGEQIFATCKGSGFDAFSFTLTGLEYYGYEVIEAVCFWCKGKQIFDEGAKVACAFCGKGETDPIDPTDNQFLALTLLAGEEAYTSTFNALIGNPIPQTRAYAKALDELALNKTITFKNGVLRFTSRFSKKPRIVSKFGCANGCDCKGESYHRQLFELVAARQSASFSLPVIGEGLPKAA